MATPMYLENFTCTTASTDADCGWTHSSSNQGPVPRLETWAQSPISAPEPGINNSQLPAYVTELGFFASSGSTNYLRTSEYSFPIQSLTGWFLDGKNGTGVLTVYLKTTVNGVDYKAVTPISMVNTGVWTTYTQAVDGNFQWTNLTDNSVVTGLTGTCTTFGVEWWNNATYGNVYLDNYGLLPEPATISLLGLGVLGLIRRK
jgi:hypothetical protein